MVLLSAAKVPNPALPITMPLGRRKILGLVEDGTELVLSGPVRHAILLSAPTKIAVLVTITAILVPLPKVKLIGPLSAALRITKFTSSKAKLKELCTATLSLCEPIFGR